MSHFNPFHRPGGRLVCAALVAMPFVAGAPLSALADDCPPIVVTEPLPGATFEPGSTATLKIAITQDTKVSGLDAVVAGVGFITGKASKPPFSLTFAVPGLLGKYKVWPVVSVEADDAIRPHCTGDPIEITVDTSATLQSLEVVPRRFKGDLALKPGQKGSVGVYGNFDRPGLDSVPLSEAALGTTYTTRSGSTDVVSVSPDGDVTAIGVGEDVVRVTHKNFVVEVPVSVVAAPPGSPSPPLITPRPTPTATSTPPATPGPPGTVACYATRPATLQRGESPLPKYIPQRRVRIIDASFTVLVDLARSKAICSPAKIDDVSPTGLTPISYVRYAESLSRTKPAQERRVGNRFEILTQFGQLTLETAGLAGVLMPASVSTAGEATPDAPLMTTFDAFNCQRVKLAKAKRGEPPFPEFADLTIRLEDAFGSRTYALMAPIRVCGSANVAGLVPDVQRNNHFVACYPAVLLKARPAQQKVVPGRVTTNAAFGVEAVDAQPPVEVCVAAIVH